jgi:predicted MFS family arabinose efflux permease
MVPALVNTGLTFQIFSILGERGVERATASFVLSLIPLMAFSGQLLSGFLVDRLQVNRMIACAFAFYTFAIASLLFVHSQVAVFLFAVVWGYSTDCSPSRWASCGRIISAAGI